ncbi:MAG: (Fe-S)-binding protein [Actinomycetota bacterium]|nr:(Fe-S)-binding protein [Actinomycetota bacterium]MDD5665722.1 (Fe-S)-binding protein [Actinomycetota bacterium]
MFIEEKCDLCGDCVFMCPYVDYDREASIRQFRRLKEGETPEIVSQCVTCVACNQFCDKGANPFDLILQRQEETGVLDIPEQNTEMFRNLPNAPSQVIPGEEDKPALGLCSVGDLIPGLFDGPLFEGMTVLKGGDYFCNVGWVHLGYETPVREGARRVVDNLAAAGADEIVLYHDDCYALLASMVQDYGIEVPFRPVHIIEYLLEYVKDHADEVKPLGINVAYQQPCASRYTPWKDEQLDELFRLIGVERVEREHDRRFALCCGSPMMPRDRDKAMRIKERNVEDAVKHGAQAIAYLCPLCMLNLRKPAAAAGLENHHIIELVKQALG